MIRNVKTAMWQPAEGRANTATVTSDFAENVKITRKKEVSGRFYVLITLIAYSTLLDQHFIKPEILVFGTVSTLVRKDDSEKFHAVDISHIVSSDYR